MSRMKVDLYWFERLCNQKRVCPSSSEIEVRAVRSCRAVPECHVNMKPASPEHAYFQAGQEQCAWQLMKTTLVRPYTRSTNLPRTSP